MAANRLRVRVLQPTLRVWLLMALATMLTAARPGLLRAQASAIPSAQSTGGEADGSHGRKLLEQMTTALGGDKWLGKTDWIEYGKGSTFYKGQANPFVFEFEEYYRIKPFGERRVIVSRNANAVTELIGIPMSKAKRDVAEVWDAENGYEVTYKGRKDLPRDDVAEFERRRQHTLDVVVKDWCHRPGTLVTFEGTEMYGRRLADKVSVLTAENDGVTLELDADTHLPLSRIFQWRDEKYKDFNSDEEQYDNYQMEGGILTPLTITRLRNGDMVSQRYLTKVVYNAQLAPDLFDPNRPLERKTK